MDRDKCVYSSVTCTGSITFFHSSINPINCIEFELVLWTDPGGGLTIFGKCLHILSMKISSFSKWNSQITLMINECIICILQRTMISVPQV